MAALGIVLSACSPAVALAGSELGYSAYHPPGGCPAAAVVIRPASVLRLPSAYALQFKRAGDAVLCLLQAEHRHAHGCASCPIFRNGLLDQSARLHAQQAVQQKWWGPGKDSRTNPATRSTPRTRIAATGYCGGKEPKHLGEITYTAAGTAASPAAAVRFWMNDPGSRPFVVAWLEANRHDVGVAVVPGSAAPLSIVSGANATTFVVDVAQCYHYSQVPEGQR